MDGRFVPLILPIAGAAYLGIHFLRERRKHERSLSWPMVSANVEESIITKHRKRGRGRHRFIYSLEVRFVYVASAEVHRGTYFKSFVAENEALHLQRSIEQGPFYIRYNPNSPIEYVVDPFRDVWPGNSKQI